ncbi:MAG: FIST C-terminal domain-containing protein [Chitinophagaceae bacterium]|nr:FIST C-terminal domain-containing protein [Chitinophagaceae bacterium]
MKICGLQYNGTWSNTHATEQLQPEMVQLVLVFGDRYLLQQPFIYDALKLRFPIANIAMASTSGEILHDEVHENTVLATAIQFESSSVQCYSTNIAAHADSFHAGKYLRSCFSSEGLQLLFILSDGTLVNGTELVEGLNDTASNDALLMTGGLAGDGERFKETVTGLNALPVSGNIVVIGFYGHQLEVKGSAFGGWDEFGPLRTVTSSYKNILYEIDGRNALDLYKEYLGPFKAELPASALLFPLSVRVGQMPAVTRTILSIDEENHTMLFAGNIPEGSKVRLMKANFERLMEASESAAASVAVSNKEDNTLAILVSCVGRKMILHKRTYEELHAARKILGHQTFITGFYSYGEISPFQNTPGSCGLQNQTMTITTLCEHSTSNH